uniref:Uncharacterized protein n=1 Tax=Arion vulgaris TaxID=1028688 RepID=A0A0B7AV17_9EUPU
MSQISVGSETDETYSVYISTGMKYFYSEFSRLENVNNSTYHNSTRPSILALPTS